ncbi:MAG: formylmethanofuran--tetrahydromethanopterin N-formyltransferase [Planctomycetaceae bacterium]
MPQSEFIAGLSGPPVADTFAEAFPMKAARVVITGATPKWAETAAGVFCGFATSVIACDVEADVERPLSPDETPDGRPGVSVLAFAFGRKGLEEAVANRVGQCVLTCPTTACYNGIPDYPRDQRIRVGGRLRYFGDGFQIAKKLGNRRFWRIPVMEGEFLCEDYFGSVDAIGGGNLLICGRDEPTALHAAETAVAAMRSVPDVVLPFPGGIVRSGSKVGSRYPKLKASTNDAYCPTLRANVDSALPDGTGAVLEIVIDGLSFERVQDAMRAGLRAARSCEGVTLLTAGNYGGNLGPHHFHLRELV